MLKRERGNRKKKAMKRKKSVEKEKKKVAKTSHLQGSDYSKPHMDSHGCGFLHKLLSHSLSLLCPFLLSFLHCILHLNIYNSSYNIQQNIRMRIYNLSLCPMINFMGSSRLKVN